MAWYCQASSHYLNQCWPSSVMPYTSLSHNELTCCVLNSHEKKIVTVSSRWSRLRAQWSQLGEVTARSQLNHGIFSMITARSQLNHGWLWPFWSPWAVTVANFYPATLKGSGVLSSPERAGGRQGRQAPLTLSRPQFFTDHYQTWQGHLLP